MIHNLSIESNPQLKDDSLLIFELITHEKRINFKKTKERVIRTIPICYDFFKTKPNS